MRQIFEWKWIGTETDMKEFLRKIWWYTSLEYEWSNFKKKNEWWIENGELNEKMERCLFYHIVYFNVICIYLNYLSRLWMKTLRFQDGRSLLSFVLSFITVSLSILWCKFILQTCNTFSFSRSHFSQMLLFVYSFLIPFSSNLTRLSLHNIFLKVTPVY